jgi:hypothetical protein
MFYSLLIHIIRRLSVNSYNSRKSNSTSEVSKKSKLSSSGYINNDDEKSSGINLLNFYI